MNCVSFRIYMTRNLLFLINIKRFFYLFQKICIIRTPKMKWERKNVPSSWNERDLEPWWPLRRLARDIISVLRNLKIFTMPQVLKTFGLWWSNLAKVISAVAVSRLLWSKRISTGVRSVTNTCRSTNRLLLDDWQEIPGGKITVRDMKAKWPSKSCPL